MASDGDVKAAAPAESKERESKESDSEAPDRAPDAAAAGEGRDADGGDDGGGDGEWVWTRVGFGRLCAARSGPGATRACVRLAWGGHVYAPAERFSRRAESIEVETFYEGLEPLRLRGWSWSGRTLGDVRKAFADFAGVPAGDVRLVVGGRERKGDARPLASMGLDGARPRVLAVVDPPVAFTFSPRARHPALVVSEDGRRVTVPTGSMRCDLTLRATEAVSDGRVFWDVAVHAPVAADDGGGARVNIGVSSARGGFNTSNYVGGCDSSWSLYLNTGETEHGGGSSCYTEPVSGGSVVRVWLDAAERTLAFSVDGRDLGVAFSDLPPHGVFPSFTLNSPGDALQLVRFGTFAPGDRQA